MKLSLNLASRRYVNQRALKRFYLLLSLLLVLVLTFQTKSYLQGRSEIESVRSSLAQLRQQLQGGTVESLSAEQIDAQQRRFRQAQVLLQRDAFRWTALFDRLEKRLPAGASVRSFNPDYAQKSLVLTGVVRGLNDLQQLLDNLHAEHFQQVFLQSQNRVEVSDGAGGKRSALSFSIKLEGVF